MGAPTSRLLRWDVTDEVINSSLSAPGGKLSAKGTIYMSNIRIVFVATKPVGHIAAFDLPLVCVFA